MLEEYDLKELIEPALLWYQQNQRDLPWRCDRDPYHIWVSEIMLQQTRVEAVKPYYEQFLLELPTVEALSACSEDRLLKLWEGLGYYRRVKNMQKAAIIIQNDYGGRMPDTYEEIRSLPGIGAYTAGAIASISFGQRVSAVDGNVMRILCRVTADSSDIAKESTKKRIKASLDAVMPNEAGEFNQALMEIGATVCLPNGAPECGSCPWKELCLSRKEDLIGQIPVKTKPKKRRIETKTILLIRDGSRVVIQKRKDDGLLAGMYEFPQMDGHLSEREVLDLVSGEGLLPLQIKRLPAAKHLFSHIEWQMIGYEIFVADVESMEQQGCIPLFASIDEMEQKYAIPSAYQAYARHLAISRGPQKNLF